MRGTTGRLPTPGFPVHDRTAIFRAGSVLPLEKAERGAAVQRRPAQNARRPRRFLRETTGRKGWNAKRYKRKMLPQCSKGERS